MPVTVPVDYETNGAGLERDMDRDAQRAGGRAGKRGGSAFGKAFGAAAGVISVGAIAGQLGKAIGGASDLVESGTKISAVFGDADKSVQAFASQGASVLGQTKQQALDAAATFGIMGKAAGLTGKDLAKFSTDLTTLSTDFSSFYNADAEVAIEAIGAALRGEAEPIRQFGVLLDEGTLKAEALALGLLKPVKSAAKIQSANVKSIESQQKYNEAVKKYGKDSLEALRAEANLGTARDQLAKATEGTIGPLTQQQKVLAANSSIFKQSKDAQGDFIETADGLANSSRTLQNEFVDLRTELGAKLLPIALDVVGTTRDLITEFRDGTGAGGEIRDVLEDIGDVLEVVYDTGKFVVGVFSDLPDGFKSTAIQAGIAFLAFRKISALLPTLGANATAAATSTTAAGAAATGAAGRFSALGGAARQAAGVGGVLLLANASQQTSKEMGALQGAAGGAALGFSVGGPFGAAVGGAAGLLLGVATSGKKAEDGLTGSERAAIRAGEEYQRTTELADIFSTSLNKFGEFNKQKIRVDALEQLREALGPAFDGLDELGLSITDVTNAALGQEDAVTKVNAAVDRYAGTVEAADKGLVNISEDTRKAGLAADALAESLPNVTEGLAQSQREFVENGIAAGDYASLIKKGIPDSVITDIKLDGDKVARRSIVDLASKIKLTPDEKRILLRTAGLPATNRDLEKLNEDANRVARDRSLQYFVNNPFVNKPRPERSGSPTESRTTPSASRTAAQSSTQLATPPITVNQNYYGPTTGRERLREVEWTLQYGTRARVGV